MNNVFREIDYILDDIIQCSSLIMYLAIQMNLSQDENWRQHFEKKIAI